MSISVTNLVKKYVPVFDEDKISKIIAKKEGKTQEYILSKWKQAGKISIDLGNAIHNSIEYYIKYNDIPKHPLLKKIINLLLPNLKSKNIQSEYIVENEHIKGRLDLIEFISDKNVIIHDIKTNYDLYKSYSSLLTPFQDLNDSPLNQYRLQLSIYKHLLEEKGYSVIGLYIWNITDKIEIIKVEEINIKQIICKNTIL